VKHCCHAHHHCPWPCCCTQHWPTAIWPLMVWPKQQWRFFWRCTGVLAHIKLASLPASLLLLSLISKKKQGNKRGNQWCCSVSNSTLHTLAILPLFTFPASLHRHVLRKEFEGSSFWNSKTKNLGNCTQELTSMFVFVLQKLQ
jgi:hypothetical protein